jgi:hypothetical protein
MRSSISFVPLYRRAAVLMLLLFVATVTYAQITPSQDAYTNTVYPTTNYGTAVTLGVVNSAASIQTTYIQFDLSAIPAGYKSSNLSKATLRLYVNTVATAGSFNIDFVNGAWKEKTVTSNLPPALGAPIVSSVPLTSANVKDYVLVDITAAVGAWLDGTQANDGIALAANSPLSATFESKENTAQSQPPEIEIVYAGIAGVATSSGSGLMGGGTSGTLNLSLTNACAANQILQWNGTAWVCANSSGGGTVTSVGLTAPSTDFLVTGSPVTTSGTLGLGWLVAPTFNNTPNAIVKRDSSGNFTAGTINAATGFKLGGNLFAFGSYTNSNAFLGFAGNATMTGSANTASGYRALYSNTTGTDNTASGLVALYLNTTGSNNTASGSDALYQNTTGNLNTASGTNALRFNTTGSANTAIGLGALQSNQTGSNLTCVGYYCAASSDGLSNATAIGALAVVGESNAVVLGSINGVNGATASTNVGIGTTTPAYMLDVNGTGNFTGLVKFASGQKFPGTSTITGVTAGTDLTGGGTSGNVTLNVDTTKVPQLAADNTFTGVQTIYNKVYIAAAGITLNTSGGTTGVFGVGQNYGVYANGTGLSSYGVYGSGSGYGVYGSGCPSGGATCSSYPTGVYGSGYSYGVYGNGTASGSAGVYGNVSSGEGVYGYSNNGYGVYGYDNGATGAGVYGVGSIWGGFFVGPLGAPLKYFVIDHPLAPSDKYLYHASVESSEMMNMYTGNVTLDRDGTASITLPDYFEALNRDFRYQLTAIGAPGPSLYIAQEIANNHFRIAGGTPGAKVSWQVTGIRQDAYAKAHPMIVEKEKPAGEKGMYLYPVEHGQPKSLGIAESHMRKMAVPQQEQPPALHQQAAVPEPPK